LSEKRAEKMKEAVGDIRAKLRRSRKMRRAVWKI
jgi:hypothetical protein